MNTDKSMKPEVRVTYDNMQAFLTLPISTQGYTFEEVMDALAKKGVKYGLDTELVREMVESKLYTIEKCVAVGKEAIPGKEGYYEFLFNTVFNSAPLERPDGTVDYHSVNLIATVGEGDEVAIYHPAVEGVNGENVKGAAIPAKRARELLPLKGSGFTRSEDGNHYYAGLTGRIEYKNNRLVISPLYEINGDTGLETGNIDFIGDVVIHGMVKPGMYVKATGTVTIDGVVESANIEAGKDVVLKSGLMGKGQSVVRAKGSLYAKFVEFATLEIYGSVNAEVLLNCDCQCGEEIIITGRRGKIIGGRCRAAKGILANCVGSEAEVKTEIGIGADALMNAEILAVERRLATTDYNLKRIEEALQKFARFEALRTKQENENPDPRKMMLLRAKIQQMTARKTEQVLLEELKQSLEETVDGRIRITGRVFGGVTVRIDKLIHQVKDEQFCVEFLRLADKIAMRRIEEDVE